MELPEEEPAWEGLGEGVDADEEAFPSSPLPPFTAGMVGGVTAGVGALVDEVVVVDGETGKRALADGEPIGLAAKDVVEDTVVEVPEAEVAMAPGTVTAGVATVPQVAGGVDV